MESEPVNPKPPRPAWDVVAGFLIWGFAVLVAASFYLSIFQWLIERLPT